MIKTHLETLDKIKQTMQDNEKRHQTDTEKSRQLMITSLKEQVLKKLLRTKESHNHMKIQNAFYHLRMIAQTY